MFANLSSDGHLAVTTRMTADQIRARLEVIASIPDEVIPFSFDSSEMEFDVAAFKESAAAAGEALLVGLEADDTPRFSPSVLATYGGFLTAGRKASQLDRFRTTVPVVSAVESNWPKPGMTGGVVTVLGDTGAGKTYYLANTAEIEVLFRTAEPMPEEVDFLHATAMVPSLWTAIEYSMVFGSLGVRVGLDSLRPIVYELSGAAMGGGISSSIFGAVTVLSNLFATVGATVVATINPMLTKVEDASRLYERLAASTTGAVFLENQRVTAWTYRTRTQRLFSSEARTPEVTEDPLVAKRLVPAPTTVQADAKASRISRALGGGSTGFEYNEPEAHFPPLDL